mgnify:FL=1
MLVVVAADSVTVWTRLVPSFPDALVTFVTVGLDTDATIPPILNVSPNDMLFLFLHAPDVGAVFHLTCVENMRRLFRPTLALVVLTIKSLTPFLWRLLIRFFYISHTWIRTEVFPLIVIGRTAI